jgi:hypothetical protein
MTRASAIRRRRGGGLFPAALLSAVLLAPHTSAAYERTPVTPVPIGREIDPHILFETSFPLNELHPDSWTAAQRKEVAYMAERIRKDNRIFLLIQVVVDPIGRTEDNARWSLENAQVVAERLRESGVRRDRMLIVPGVEDASLFDEPRWDGFARRQKVTIRGLQGGPWLQRRETAVTLREELPPEGTVSLLEPVEGTTDHSRHTLRGTTEDTVRTVSIVIGKETKTVAVYGGKFEVPVSLAPGENRIVVTGLDAYGRALRAVRQVRYEPPKPSIELTSPLPGVVVDITRSPVITVRGTIKSSTPIRSATLIQNDIPLSIRVRPDGSFEQLAALITDEDTFKVEVGDKEGWTGVSEIRKVVARGVSERPLMAILHWDEDDVDLDLHITDATGHHTYWDAPEVLENASAIPMGILLLDNRSGFGPEVFTIEKNVSGVFTFSADYFRGKKNCRAYLTVVLFAGSPSRKMVRIYGPLEMSPAKRDVLLVQVSLPSGTILDLAK